MTTIFVNGVKSSSGGGKRILTDYLEVIAEARSEHRYVVLTPDRAEYGRFAGPNVDVVDVPRAFTRNALFPALYLHAIPRLLRAHRVGAILNFGDIVLPSRLPQLYLFDWPFAVCNDSEVWKRLPARDRVTQRVKRMVFRRTLPYAAAVVAQTQTMKAKLEATYGLENITIVPGAVSRTDIRGGTPWTFPLPAAGPKLLFPANYYPHKNFEVLVPLARLIRARSLPYVIVTTIDAAEHPGASAFLQQVTRESLGTTIINVGRVVPERMASLYSQCDALLMPTLLETFALPYVEAMFHRKAILTSRRDFAEDVCGSAAFYFDPVDPASLLSAVELAFGSPEARRTKVAEGAERLSRMPTWEDVAGQYQQLLDRAVAAR